ncbi:MAG: hypothetical protein K6F92_02670 [Lachnospiraceae bacterium]|nr:hypothetical protein [Lachnospiraceae bacterium]
MRRLTAFILSAAILTGCAAETEYDIDNTALVYNDMEISKETMNLFYNYAMQKENMAMAPIYGTSFWNEQVSSSGTNYATYMHNTIFYNEVVNVLALCEVYDESGYDVVDEAAISDESARCFEELSKAGIETSVTDVNTFLTLIDKADYVRNLSVTDGELSEEEYRVVTVYEAYFDRLSDARRFYKQLENGEGFLKILSDASEVITANYSRDSDITDIYKDILFKLKDGEYNGILETGDRYFIVYMAQTFNEELSQKHCEELKKQMLDAVWTAKCATQNQKARIVLNYDYYDTLVFSYSDETTLATILDNYLKNPEE